MTLTSGEVSVVIPAFNAADSLEYSLSALVKARGDLPVEIVVVDDSSTDSTPQVIREANVKHVRGEENLGQSWARNYGSELTESKYILFLDSDVVVYEDCFQRIEDFSKMEKPKGLIGLNGVFSVEHPFQEWSSLIYNTLQHMLTNKPAYNFGVNTSFFLVERQEFIDIGRFREDIWFMEDNEFAQRMAAKGKYTLHGPVQFIHRKHVSWRWLIRAHILGGKMHRFLAEMMPKDRNNTIRTPHKVSDNRVFLKFLLGGGAGSIAFVLYTLCPNLYLKIVCGFVWGLMCLGFLAECSILLKVKRNPLFFLTGLLTYMILPWLIVLGRIVGQFSVPSERDWKIWRGKRSFES